MGSSYGKIEIKSSIQLNDIISLSSFEIVKNLKMNVVIYIILVVAEIGYMITIPA